MTTAGDDVLARVHVPDSGNAVTTAGDDVLAIGCNGNGLDCVRMRERDPDLADALLAELGAGEASVV